MTRLAAWQNFFRAQNRRAAWEQLEGAYSAYVADPNCPSVRFAILRRLIKVCRLHDLGGNYAAMLAELGRVDDEAPALWQLVFQRRKPTRPHREKKKRDKDRRTKSLSQDRQWRRFIAVMDRVEAGDTLPAACTAVAEGEGNHVLADTVRLDYLGIAGQYRRAGRDTVEFGDDDAIRRIPLPRAGRPRKIS